MGKDKRASGKSASSAPRRDEVKLVATNSRAFHDFHVEREIEAGIELLGTEVKSLRNGQCQLTGSYARVDEHIWTATMHGVNIPEYRAAGAFFQHPPQRTRRLLLHKRELEKLRRELHEKGVTLVPLKIYFKGGRAKVLLGVCKGKRQFDKRESMKKADVQRDLARWKR